ncbi:pentatricopeptide repeat-containing protein 2, mitochondrial-like [Glandiceps talaboti]
MAAFMFGRSLVQSFTKSSRTAYSPVVSSVRHLLPPEKTRYDDFEKEKLRAEDRLYGDLETFHKAMTTKVERNDVLFTDELKMLLHTCHTEEQASFALQVVKKYHLQNSNVAFRKFRFGPVIMRMCNSLGLRERMVEVATDKDLHGFFSDSSTFNIVMDTLFEAGEYERVLTVFEEFALQGVKKAKDSYTLALAACYKLNTPESYDMAQTILEESQISGEVLVRVAYSFAAALAINQNDPQKALSILSLIKYPEYKVCRSLQIIADCMTDNLVSALKNLQNIYDRDIPSFVKRWEVVQEAVDKVKDSVKNNEELETHFEEIQRHLQAGGHIYKDSIDSLLCRTPVANRNQYNKPFDNRSYGGRSFKPITDPLLD